MERRLRGLNRSCSLQHYGNARSLAGFYREARPCLADLVLASQQTATAVYTNVTVKDGVGHAENWCDLPKGQRRYLALETCAIRDKNGAVIGVVEFLNDLTASEQARLALEAERTATAQAQADVVSCLAGALQDLASGDLTSRLDRCFAPDFESLRSDFNQASTGLHAAMSTIADRTQGLQASGAEITRAAADLSRRTEQQAASLEQTAAALDQITATVRKTADGALEARNIVGLAKTEAEASEAVVKDAVMAMSEIEASSRKISQIIGVIDEIAFQTNLLALNAGVEAARAGDAGRGFAVVASEVRALAQRSADAAKEIKTLISASSLQVAQGVNRVGETGKALTHIAEQVTRIEGVVVQISASAQEQATGLQEVNCAVNQMDQVTQQNAAMVDETIMVSTRISDEAEALASLIAAFTLGPPPTARFAPAKAYGVAEVGRRPAATPQRRVAAAAGSWRAGARAPSSDGGWEGF